MWLIVGLGNPGAKYGLNRHNVGFMALDAYCASIGSAGAAPKWREEREALVTRFKLEDDEVLLAKPQTFMNNSGEPTQRLMDFYKIAPTQLLVLHDEIEIGFGALRVHKNRGAGGHNGIKSLHEKLGTPDYARLRIGVGRPTIPQMDVAAYVLQNFSNEEQPLLHDFLAYVGDAMESFILKGYDKTASQFTRGSLLGAGGASADSIASGEAAETKQSIAANNKGNS